MSERTLRIVHASRLAAWVVAGAGIVGLISIGLTLAVLAWNVLAARRAHVRARSHALARAARKAAP